MESSEIEHRTNMECFKLGKTATESHEMLIKVYGEAAVSRKTVYKWIERFHGGAEDEQRSGRPSTSTTDENVSKINEMIKANRRLTIREISNALNISFGSVQHVLTKNINMRRVSANFVPRLLLQEQKERRLSISLELRDRANLESGSLRSVITGGES
jgi:histone-lysine N-methyltransferase SETMAR